MTRHRTIRAPSEADLRRLQDALDHERELRGDEPSKREGGLLIAGMMAALLWAAVAWAVVS